MRLPQVGDNDFTERAGIIHIEGVVNNARCIWRETTLRDVGIDGQIEYVNPTGQATGRLILVQVKTGASYFEGGSAGSVSYSPAERHRNYWGHAPLPVVLVLHNPDDGETIWVDARREIQKDRGDPLVIPRDETFDTAGVLKALAWNGAPLPAEQLPPTVLFKQMLTTTHDNAALPLSFLDLFVNGLTDMARSVYFGMDLVTEIANAILTVRGSDFGWGIAAPEYEFLDRYVAFVVAHNLVRFDFDWYRQSHEEFQTVATLLGPLTPRGRALVRYIAELDRGRSVERGRYDHVVVERFVQMVWRQDVRPRTEWIEEFKQWALGQIAA